MIDIIRRSDSQETKTRLTDFLENLIKTHPFRTIFYGKASVMLKNKHPEIIRVFMVRVTGLEPARVSASS